MLKGESEEAFLARMKLVYKQVNRDAEDNPVACKWRKAIRLQEEEEAAAAKEEGKEEEEKPDVGL